MATTSGCAAGCSNWHRKGAEVIAALFWCSVGLVLYAYAFYPALVGLWSRLAPRPVRKDAGFTPRVAMIVVAHNEAQRIAAKIETCLGQDYPADHLRLIVASDGSTDQTDDLVRAHPDPRVQVLAFGERRGKAACLNDAVATCDEEIIVFTDARQRLNPDAVRQLMANLADPSVGAVSGELVFLSEDQTAVSSGVGAYWRYEKFIRKSQAAIHSVPGVTGALYALRRANFRPIPTVTILDDVAIPMQAAMQGKRVVFEADAIAYDHPSTHLEQERRRKIRTLAGNYQLLRLFPALLLPWKNPIFLQFVSHKVLRLIAPWAMLCALITNVLLAPGSAGYSALLALQLAFYILPLAGAWIPGISRLAPVRLASTFILLNGFAALGLVEYLTNPQAHQWRTSPTPPKSETGC